METTKRKNWKLIMLITAFALISCIIALPYTTRVIEVPAGVDATKSMLLVGMMINLTVGAFIASIIGLYLGPKVGLKADILRQWVYKDTNAKFQKKDVITSVVAGMAAIVLAISLDYFVFVPFLPELQAYAETAPKVNLLIGISTIFQGGFTEEVCVRFGFMTFIVWLLSIIFKKVNNKTWIYWVGIIALAIFFGIAHVPALAGIVDTITPLLIARTIIINTIAGIVYGYLYWKKGLEYAIIAHIVGDIVAHSFFG